MDALTYQDFVLLCLFYFFVAISPIMIGLAIYGIYITTLVLSSALIEFNEKHLLPKEKELSLDERLEIAFSQPLEMKEEYSEWDKQFVMEYNERNNLR